MTFSLLFTRAFLLLLWHSLPVLGGLALLITLLGCSLALIDDLPISTGIYFAWITSMTVGYGDLSPANGVSRLVAVIVAFLGIPLNGMVVALAILAARLAIDRHGRLGRLVEVAEARLTLDPDESLDLDSHELPD